jgi:hypothetical protein
MPASLQGGHPAVGRAFFISTYVMGGIATCVICHADPKGTDGTIVSDLDLLLSQSIKIPHLRNIYQKLYFDSAPGSVNLSGFGLTHDGKDGGLLAHFSIPRFDSVLRENLTNKQNLAAYLMCYDTGTPPAVGYSRTLTASNINDSTVSNGWHTLESLHTPSVGLIGKGTFQGVRHGFLYDRPTGTYQIDQKGVAPLTHADLAARISAGDTLTIMGVPTTTAQRLGIDRNADGVLDGDEVLPALAAALSNGGIEVSWQTPQIGLVLEWTDTLERSDWKPETRNATVQGDRSSVTIRLEGQSRFYRLRGL